MEKVTHYWKAIAAAVGSALLVWNQLSPSLSSIFPDSWAHPLAVVVAVATVVATYAVPYKPQAAVRQ